MMDMMWIALMIGTMTLFVTGCSAGYLELCHKEMTLQDGSPGTVVTKPEMYGLHKCKCYISQLNSTETSKVLLSFTFLRSERTAGNASLCTPVLKVGGEMTHYACSQLESDKNMHVFQYHSYLLADQDMEIGVFNPNQYDISITMNVTVYGSPANLTCQEDEVTIPTTYCPCEDKSTVPMIKYAQDVPTNKRLTIGLVAAFLFLLILGVCLAVYYLWWKKREPKLGSQEKVSAPGDRVGSENRGYHNSNANLKENMYQEINDGKQTVGFPHDPDLNLNLATPANSTNDSFVPAHRGSTDSGLYSMPGGPKVSNGESPYIRANSMDQLNRSQPDIAGRPDIMMGGGNRERQGSRASSIDELNRSQPDIAGRPDMFAPGRGGHSQVMMNPANLDELYANPHKVRSHVGYPTPPQPHGPPPAGPLSHSQPRAGSYEQLHHPYPHRRPQHLADRSFQSSQDRMNRSYQGSSNELYATDDSHNTSQTVETDV